MAYSIAPRAAAFCLLRDCADIAPVLCGHYLRLGFGRVLIIDDGSTDGTFEVLSELAAKTDRMVVRRSGMQYFDQARVMTKAANELIDEGFQLLFPFDGDEFWNLSNGQVIELHDNPMPRKIFGTWVNFAQSRTAASSKPLNLLRVGYGIDPNVNANHGEVQSFEKPFLAFGGEKLGFWSEQHVSIHKGNHDLFEGPELEDPSRFEVFHLPLRSRSELAKRGLNYAPREDPERHLLDNWQSRFHQQIATAGRDGEVWAANSVGPGGKFGAYATNISSVKDNRLRMAVIQSLAYLLMRYRFWGL